MMRYVNSDTIVKGKFRDSINQTDIVSNHDTVMEYFNLFTRTSDIHDDPH